jgi:hypothetical protein
LRVAVALVCEDGEVGNSESKSYAAGLGEVVRIFLGRFYVVGVAIGGPTKPVANPIVPLE